jgi:hypothetical protein
VTTTTFTTYLVKGVETIGPYYFAPDSAAQQRGETYNFKNATWLVGDIDAANQQLAITLQNYKNSDLWAQHFSQTKLISVDESGDETWEVCDITTEPANTDVIYNLFCDVNPQHIPVTGTEAALQLLATQQQDLIAFVGLDAVVALDNFPPEPKPKKVV